MKTMKVKWTGIRPLVLHNGMLADPLNPYVRAIKKLTAKKNKKTDADHAEISRLEWMGGLYLAEDGKTIVIPSDNIERCVQEGARKSRLGKDVQAAVFCAEAEVAIEHEALNKLTTGTPESLEALYENKDGRFTLHKGVKVTTNRVIRVRPLVPTGWALSFNLEYDETIVNQHNLEQAMRDAGALVGLGDWRPKFGRFSVEVAA